MSLPLTVWNVRSVLRAARSQETLTLNENLKQHGLYWSISRESIQSIDALSPEDDLKKAIQNFILLGALGLFSFLGFFILFVVSLSLHFFIRNRSTEEIFSSELSRTKNLSLEKTRTLLADFGGTTSKVSSEHQ